MKTIFLFFLFIISQAQAQTEAGLLAQAANYEAVFNENAAFETYKQVIKINARNDYALWKLSELSSRIGARQPTARQKQAFFINGKKYAAAALAVNPKNADGYYAMAVAMGRLALVQEGKDRIQAVKQIRSNAEKAIQLNPQHGRAWHVMGKWHYEVSNLNMFEKAGLKFIYGGLPPASLKESILAYEKAKTLEPAFALNFLELAKAYKRNGQLTKGIEQLKQIQAIPNKTFDDQRIKTEAANLLKKWQDE